jgi:hypothetical protein
VEDWAEIRCLHRSERMPIKVIARVMGCSKNAVRAALRSEGPPKYERLARGSVVDAVEPRIRELLAAVPTMPATVIAERIGWEHSIRVLRDRRPRCRIRPPGEPLPIHSSAAPLDALRPSRSAERQGPDEGTDTDTALLCRPAVRRRAEQITTPTVEATLDHAGE